MKANLGIVLVAGCLVVVGGAGRVRAAEEKAACPAEVSQATAMVAKARAVLSQPSTGTGTGGGRTPQGDAASGAGRAPETQPGTSAPRGLATSAASEISPWNPHPGDKTLQARTTKARRLAAQAQRFCKAGKMDEAKARAAEAITVLDPK